MARRPTPKQTELLTAITDHTVWFDGARWLRFADQVNANVTADVTRAVANGWVSQAAEAGDRATLTSAGKLALDEARVLAEFAALPDEWRGVARVTRRARGMHPIRGMGKVPDGRNVQCFDCYDTAKAAGSRTADSTVWYTNEGGREADRDAEVALARHVLAHYRGELATPSRDTEAPS